MNRIKELRVSLNFSQKELAERLGCNQTAVGKYEREDLEPNLDTLKKLSILFDCSIDYLIGHSDDFGVIQANGQQPLTSLQQELLHYFDKMTDSQKNRLIGYAFAMVN